MGKEYEHMSQDRTTGLQTYGKAFILIINSLDRTCHKTI